MDIAALKLKAIIALIVIVIIGGVVWKMNHDGDVKDALKKEVVTKDVVIDAQDGTIKTGEKVKEVKEDSGVKLDTEVKAVVKKQVKIDTKAEITIQDIQDRYNALPLTPDNVVAKSQELSTARIDSLWEAYCIGAPDATECQVPVVPVADVAVDNPQGA